MSSNPYLSNPNVPFFGVDDSLDDDTFLRQSRPGGSGGYILGGRQNAQPPSAADRLADRQRQLMEERRRVEQSTVEAAQRSLGVLHESEQVGQQTAEDLVRQREQLERTENRLDDINASLNTSQKHINNIKSVFSSLRSYFGSRNAPPATATTAATKPATTTPVVATGGATVDAPPHPTLVARGVVAPSLQCQTTRGPADHEEILNRNLDDMCAGLSRLQGLATGLQTEITDQNQMLDRIQDKTERADITINTQNKQMNRILKQ